jgi:hypothetical protein
LFGARAAGRASATSADEWHGDPVAETHTRDLRADLGDDAGELVSGDVRQCDIRVVAGPAVPVATAQPGRAYLDHDAVWRASGFRHRPDLRLGSERVDD